jgi:hypothetical protein
MDILKIVNRLFPGAIRAYWSPQTGYVVFLAYTAIALARGAATAFRSITRIEVVKS